MIIYTLIPLLILTASVDAEDLAPIFGDPELGSADALDAQDAIEKPNANRQLVRFRIATVRWNVVDELNEQISSESEEFSVIFNFFGDSECVPKSVIRKLPNEKRLFHHIQCEDHRTIGYSGNSKEKYFYAMMNSRHRTIFAFAIAGDHVLIRHNSHPDTG